MSKDNKETNDSCQDSVTATELNPQTIAEMAYLSTVPIIQSVLQDTGTFIRNNNIVYTAATSLALQKIAEGDESAEKILQTMEKLMNYNETYLRTMSSTCAEILVEFKKIAE